MTALGPGRNRLFLRGVADSPFNGESQSTVAVLLDDARLTYAAPDPDVALVDMDRVEVLKGPQGSLYGTGALGGIYHLVSRRAELDKTTLSLASGSEISTRGGVGYSATAIANLPLVPGTAGLRLVGYSRLEPGWIDTGSRKDSNSTRLLGARAGLGIVATDDWRLDFTGFAQWLESNDSRYVYEPGARARPAQLPEPHDNDLRHVSARLAREGHGIDVVLSSGMTWHEVGDELDAVVGAASFGLADPQKLTDKREYRVWDNEARVSGNSGPWSWLLGISYIHARQSDLWTLTAPTDQLVIDDDRRVATDSAIFGDLTIPLGSKVKLDVGARLFHSTLAETRAVSTGIETREMTRNGVTPSLSISWRPGENRMGYIRYGSAFRQGGLDLTASGTLETLKEDELATIEAGWRERIANRGSLEFGAYFTSWNDMQSDLLLPSGLIETRNAGKAQIVGLEGTVSLPFGEGWDASLGGTIQDARLIRNDLGIELDDSRLPVIPQYVVRGALERTFPLGAASGSLKVKLRYVGPSRLSFDPVLDRPMGRMLESGIEGRLRLDRWQMALKLDNLLQRSADEFSFGNPLRFFTARQYTPQRPLNASLTFQASF